MVGVRSLTEYYGPSTADSVSTLKNHPREILATDAW